MSIFVFYLNVCAVHKAVGEDLLIVAVRRTRDAKVRDGRIGSQCGDQLGGPIRAGDDRVVVHLSDCLYKLGDYVMIVMISTPKQKNGMIRCVGN